MSAMIIGPNAPKCQRLIRLDLSALTQSGGDWPIQHSYPPLPPHLYQPVTGLPFNPSTYITIPAIGVTATILQRTVPNGYYSVINQLGNNFVGGGFVDGSGALIWQLTLDNVPYPNFEAIIASLGNPANPSLIGAVTARERQIIRLTVQNVSVVTAGQLIGGRLSGYDYPLELADATQWF